MKKILTLLGICLIVTLITACTPQANVEPINLNVTSGPIALEIGDTFQLEITTNDSAGYELSNTDPSVVSVSSTGLITALNVGSSTITVQSLTDETVSKSVAITVTRVNNLSIEEPSTYLWAGQTLQLAFDADGEVLFTSSNEGVATINAEGLVTAISPGAFTITMQLAIDATITQTIDLIVYDVATTIILEGNDKANMGSTVLLTAVLGPETSVPVIVWSSSDETIATVSNSGVVTPLRSGVVTISATSISDAEVFANLDITIVNEIVVDGTKNEGDTVTVDGLVLTFGESLFNTFEAALIHATDGANISLYNVEVNEAVTINLNQITLTGMTSNVVFNEKLTIDGNDFSIHNVEFKSNGAIEVLTDVTNIQILDNSFTQLSSQVSAAIKVHEANGVRIESNQFTDLEHDAIDILSIVNGAIDIHKNIITDAEVAIKLAGSGFDLATTIKLERNEIRNVVGGLEVGLDNTEILSYARFNVITDYTEFPAKSTNGSRFDFTLNYWGVESIDLSQFINIPESMLMGNYASEAAIISEADFDPTAPLFLFITSDINLMWVNQEQQIEFSYLPYELTNARFRFRTTDADTLMVSPTGLLQPKQSGTATITIEASHRASSASDTLIINITTDPGIDLEPTIDTQSLVVGDSVTIKAVAYPITIKDSLVTFESSNPAIATVNSLGEVTSHGAGNVIITARLIDDIQVTESIYLTFYDALDSNNLMDLITMNQQSFLKKFDTFVTGTGPSYRYMGFESVSNFYFEEVNVNTSRMIPDMYKGGRVRPGIALSSIPAPAITYNPLNVHWITVHDTANTDPSASALSHANYLLNQAQINGAQVSWHYTIDDYDMYQHIPEGEVAWHAGDGSTLVGQSATYLGGGNRNAIAIEMNVGMGDDLYRIWQRTAKFAAEALVRHNLPREHIKFHQHFSGKHCPNALFVSGLEPKFQKMADIEYLVALGFPGAQITMESHDLSILDNAGRIVEMPTFNTTVSYTVTVVYEGITTIRTFNVYVPGTTR